MAKEDIDAVTGTATTGHEWDGIKELNNPLPRWWLWTFYASIVWAVLYWIAYPAWPLVSSYTSGLLGYSSRANVAADMAALQALRGEKGAALAKAELVDIEKDPALLAFARAQGRAAFGDNCAPCHGTGATGSKGYPNLNDDDWLWGGTLEAIHQTLQFGIRSGHANARENLMPAFGKDGTLKKDEIVQVASYVRSLAGLPVPQGVNLEAGKKLFADNCTVCHGDDAKGNPELGAPNLTDRIWLYGSDQEAVVETITNSRAGVMPAWADRLDPVTVKALAVYVHTLGGGR
ncbi:cytochrome-c oxidase, cbb3-type subunit III [Rhodoplanes serenus]|uniref:Cbb3-type cytochrome c oxidase subunit n=1 Tax=Rhodoplanes serenus TaxID=200615 RepID=A0A9X5AUB3_9BRAD|nr:cytochrome-c oxidase, cbb3-type subunit III [Rhodoplanes serenus]MTW18229.1 cytochrome-c oxidase, cbb3-type subunit III [Rhodoplanes serenus]